MIDRIPIIQNGVSTPAYIQGSFRIWVIHPTNGGFDVAVQVSPDYQLPDGSVNPNATWVTHQSPMDSITDNFIGEQLIGNVYVRVIANTGSLAGINAFATRGSR